MKNWTRFVRLFTMKMKCSRTNCRILTFHSSKNTKLSSKEVKIFSHKSINGKIDIKLHRKASWKSLKIWELLWIASERAWLTGKLDRWQFASKTKDLLSKTRFENAEIFLIVAIGKSMIFVKRVKSKKFLSWSFAIMKIFSAIKKINLHLQVRNSSDSMISWDKKKMIMQLFVNNNLN